MAYNEEKNISKILDALLLQKVKQARIAEIIVVSSGSTDKTDAIVKEYEKAHKKIRLITQAAREGKSSAINLFIQNAKHEHLIVESADTIPEKFTVERLITPFNNKKIGMTGGRPMPVNSADDFVGFAVKFLWKLHHRMSIFKPKLGEMIAFKKVFEKIPDESAVDEASIEAIITACGYQTLYVSNAIVINKGPENIADFIKQRKRIAIGHLWLKSNQGYDVTSNDIGLLARLFISECLYAPKDIVRIIAVAKIELWCRFKGYIEFHFKKANPFIWDISQSTKHIKK
jgi:glycosyltransferase involved in cell wall biosynthesis